MTDFKDKIIKLYKLLNETNEKYKVNEKFVKYVFNKITNNYEYIIKCTKYILSKNNNYDNYYKIHDEMYINLLLKKNTPELYLILLSKIKQIFYTCLIYISDITLKASDYINNNKLKNNKYNLIIANNKINKKSFELFLIFYYINTLFVNKDLFIGLDFEFNTKIIALMQINFEEPIINNDNNFIYIIYPPDLQENTKKYFIKKILCNNRIYKILHGSDSLDIPYLYFDFLIQKDYIIKFTDKLIDTRFLCEYYNIEYNSNNKCKIYYVLNNHKIITNKIFKKILKNENDMGPIYDIKININNMSNELMYYTLYDVLFLKYLCKYFMSKGEMYNKIIPEFTRFIFLERRNIVNIKDNLEEKVTKMNNYMIYIKNNKFRLNDLFKLNINNIKLNNIKEILMIKYFRKTFTIILKYIFYSFLNKNFNIYINKNELITDNNNINIIDLFNKYKYVSKLLNLYENKLIIMNKTY
jgi:hypothetical protein